MHTNQYKLLCIKVEKSCFIYISIENYISASSKLVEPKSTFQHVPNDSCMLACT